MPIAEACDKTGRRLFKFYLYSPSGNTTLFLVGPGLIEAERIYFCREALSALGAEQAAFIDPDGRGFTMGGGEFCVNACRAFGAWLDIGHEDKQPRFYKAFIGGQRLELEVVGGKPVWQVAASFTFPAISITSPSAHLSLAHLPGISHILIRTDAMPSEEEAVRAGREFLAAYGLRDLPAAGVVWWRPDGEEIEIAPFVCVNSSGTAMLESSCGSGSLAVSALLAAETLSVRQPSGDVLKISRRDGFWQAAGAVSLVASGEIWLPDFICEE